MDTKDKVLPGADQLREKARNLKATATLLGPDFLITWEMTPEFALKLSRLLSACADAAEHHERAEAAQREIVEQAKRVRAAALKQANRLLWGSIVIGLLAGAIISTFLK